MLLLAGTGVVMANAPKSLREISGLFPTASNEADGVAFAIEHFVFGNSQAS
jgi:hydroxymethylpyrimidine pyrophosphatase-like HAD family hydrolase